jgi:polyisoprenoid-binding protein YceI
VNQPGTPLLFSAWLFAALVLFAPAARSVGYRINPARSDAEFGVRLLWWRTVTGHFTQIDGEVNIDPQGHAVVDARIATSSVVMNSERLRRWVLAPDFFNAAQYPAIRFLSQPITFAMLTSGGVLSGQLTLRGITQPMRFQLQPANCTPTHEPVCVIEARGSMSRSAFGMNSHRTALSDEVQLGLLIALEPAPN